MEEHIELVELVEGRIKLVEEHNGLVELGRELGRIALVEEHKQVVLVVGKLVEVERREQLVVELLEVEQLAPK